MGQMNFELIQAVENDRPYLLNLRKLTMVEHLEMSGLFLSDDEHQLRLNDAYECSYIIIYEQKRIGVLKYQELDNKFEIMQFQIHPDFQRQSLGKMIMKQMLGCFKPKTVELTVLKENPALKFYKRLGFEITGEDQYEFHMQIQNRNEGGEYG